MSGAIPGWRWPLNDEWPPSDERLTAWRTMAKRKVSSTRPKIKGKYSERQFECVSVGDDALRFQVFLTWNTVFPALSYSAGLRVYLARGPLVLCRYNGRGHAHTNKLDSKRMLDTPHIHLATHLYMAAGHKEDGYAEATNRFSDYGTALRCLVADCNITGIVRDLDSPNASLFDL